MHDGQETGEGCDGSGGAEEEVENGDRSILPIGDGDASAGNGDGAAARLMRSTEAARELGMACSV